MSTPIKQASQKKNFGNKVKSKVEKEKNMAMILEINLNTKKPKKLKKRL